MAPVGSYELLVWLIRTSGAAERGPSAEHPCNRAACRPAIRSSNPAADAIAPLTAIARRERAPRVRPDAAACRSGRRAGGCPHQRAA